VGTPTWFWFPSRESSSHFLEGGSLAAMNLASEDLSRDGNQHILWGGGASGVRFGLRVPEKPIDAGNTLVLELFCENRSPAPVWVFGFRSGYPRSLKVSPPKPQRPYIRVSFGDTSVLHPPEAFTRVGPGERIHTGLDLSFAFDRRGVGIFPVLFAYDPVRAGMGLRGFVAPDEGSASTGLGELVISRAQSLRSAGIDDPLEATLDALLVAGDPSLVERLRQLGPGGARFAARRLARVLATGADSVAGWRALDVLEMLGEAGLAAVRAENEDLPHARDAFELAEDWLRFRLGHPARETHLPFQTMLDELIRQPDRRGNLVVSWTAYDSPIHGSMRMEIFGNGDRIVVVRPAGANVPSTRRTSLSPMHMQGLLETLHYGGMWLLRPLRKVGFPDEPRPALEVQLALGEPYTRRVAMWNGEWRQGPGFRIADMLDRLAAQVRPSVMPTRL
jgi:hypothetical protein